jgi:uncharacterized membrane protein
MLLFALLAAMGIGLPIVALLVALKALREARASRPVADTRERLASLEALVLGLIQRVWALERRTGAPAPAPEPATSFAPAVAPGPATAPALAPAPPPPPAEAEPEALGLEQRIGARWTTWVGIVVILFGISFFLKWAFDNDYLGPAARVVLGLAGGLVMVTAGLALHRRRDAPYLSEGLAGGGLGALYLSLYAAHAFYALIDAGRAFVFMGAVTLLGTLTAVVSSRQITAVLAVLGGLLTPVLLTVQRPDERTLLAYLLALDALVLGIARFRTWPALNRLAWGGTALLAYAALARAPVSPHPLTRLGLLSALFLLFLAVPLLRARATGSRADDADLGLIVLNPAGYFWAVYVTLERWLPAAEAPWALALAVVYALAAADHAGRVRDDELTPRVLEGVAWTCLSVAVPLALDDRWLTLAWAAQGAALLWAARFARTPVAVWGGAAALGMAAFRVVALDHYRPGDAPAVWNLTFLLHVSVVSLLVLGGILAVRAPRESVPWPSPEDLGSGLWVGAALTLAVLLWREPTGLWPATLLTLELVALAWLARASAERAYLVATPLLAVAVIARTLVADDALARRAAVALPSLPLASRVAACAGLALAGRWLARSPAGAGAPAIGQALSAAAGLALLWVLSVTWRWNQEAAQRAARRAGLADAVADIGLRLEIGLSVLWTLYAAATMAWGFIRSSAPLRGAALALFGLTVLKVFSVDLATVNTVYRIVSFLVLGVVLVTVGYLYQRSRRAPAREANQ